MNNYPIIHEISVYFDVTTNCAYLWHNMMRYAHLPLNVSLILYYRMKQFRRFDVINNEMYEKLPRLTWDNLLHLYYQLHSWRSFADSFLMFHSMFLQNYIIVGQIILEICLHNDWAAWKGKWNGQCGAKVMDRKEMRWTNIRME